MNPAQAITELEGPTSVQPLSSRVLPQGTRLRDYEITGLIGEGGFGIVYLAWDHSLQRKVAVKEYMPASMVSRVAGSSAIVIKSDRHLDTFKAGLKSFVNEARLLARFDHPSLVKVYRFWEENGTAYMVMPFYEGPTLKTALAELGHVPSEAELRTWLKPILDAISVLHAGETWHQSIAPDAIVLTPIGPVLLGFASAESAIAAARHTPAAAIRPGFGAIEQYGSVAETTRGPWTDLYALAAVVYQAITGAEPMPATARLADDRLRPLSLVAAGLYSEDFLASIDAALAVQPELRPRDHRQFRALMGDIDAPARIELAPRRDLMQEPFAGEASNAPREVTVPDKPLMPKAAEPASATSAAVASQPVAVPVARASIKAAAKAAVAAPVRAERSLPSWMQPGEARIALGKRAIYGLVAGTFALTGIAALALQFYARQNSHASEPSTTASVPTTGQTAVPRVAAPANAIVAPAPQLLAPAAAPAPVVPKSIATAVTPSVAAPAVTATTAGPTPSALTPDSAGIPAAAIARPPLSAASAARAYLAPPANEAERQARCIEILQKASLEQITPAETSFFKKECK